MTPQEIQRGIEQLGPWFYPFEFGGGLRTTALVPPAVTEIFDTRLRMVEAALAGYFGEREQGLECLDIGCHEGFYSLAMARRGNAGHRRGRSRRKPVSRPFHRAGDGYRATSSIGRDAWNRSLRICSDNSLSRLFLVSSITWKIRCCASARWRQ